MSIEELIAKLGKQPDGETGLQKFIAKINVNIEKSNNQVLEEVMAEFNIDETH